MKETSVTFDSHQRSRCSRRGFLQGTLAAALLSRGLHAAEPVARNGHPHLKLSLAAYSFNKQLPVRPAKPNEGAMSLNDFIDLCAAWDLDGTELTSYFFPKVVTPEALIEIKERTFRLGLDISGTAIRNDFCVPEGEARDAQLAMTREWIDYAAFMGAPVIRIFAGKVPKGDREMDAIDRCVSAINESVQYAATKGVVLALENHHGITGTAEQMLAIVERVDESPWFGVNFDSGNFATEDPYRDLEKIAPYTKNAQLKVVVQPNGGDKVPADIPRVINILKQANYRGYLVLEYEEPNPHEEIPKYLKQIRDLIG